MVANTCSCFTCSLESLFLCVHNVVSKTETFRFRRIRARVGDTPSPCGSLFKNPPLNHINIALTHDTVTREPMRHIYHVCFLSTTFRSRLGVRAYYT